jgi:hypothetical protein
MYDPDQDDLDRLFSRAGVDAPPSDVGGRARARLRAIRGARRLTLMALADLAALAALAALAYLLGGALAAGELPLLVRLVAEDRGLALEARGELATAFLQGIPWRYVLAVAINGLVLYGLTAALLRATDAVRETTGAGR